MTEPPMNDTQQSVSTETALRLLAKQQRRQILDRMADTPDGTAVDQLIEHLAAAGPGSPDDRTGAGQRGTALHHVHLPKLQAAGVVVHDSEQQAVRSGRHFDAVLELARAIEEYDGQRTTTT